MSEFKCDCNNFLLRLLRLVLLSRFILLISRKGELARRLLLKLPEAVEHLLFLLLLLLLFSLPPNMVTKTSRENPFLWNHQRRHMWIAFFTPTSFSLEHKKSVQYMIPHPHWDSILSISQLIWPVKGITDLQCSGRRSCSLILYVRIFRLPQCTVTLLQL